MLGLFLSMKYDMVNHPTGINKMTFGAITSEIIEIKPDDTELVCGLSTLQGSAVNAEEQLSEKIAAPIKTVGGNEIFIDY